MEEKYYILRRLFQLNLIREYGDINYHSNIFDTKEEEVSNFFENANKIIKIIEIKKKLNIGIEKQLKFLTSLPGYNKDYSKIHSSGYIHPYNLNYIQHKDAIKLFNSYDQYDNKVIKIFIILQFFIYYQNKKDRNQEDFCSFLEKVFFDESTLVSSTILIIINSIKNVSGRSLYLFKRIFESCKLDKFMEMESNNKKKIFKEKKISSLLNLHSQDSIDYNPETDLFNFEEPLSVFTYVNSRDLAPKTMAQYKLLKRFNLNMDKDLLEDGRQFGPKFVCYLDFKNNHFKESILNGKRTTSTTQKIRIKNEKILEEKSELLKNENMEKQDHEVIGLLTRKFSNLIIRKILGYTISSDTIRDSPLNDDNSWLDYQLTFTTEMFQIASVSKNFHFNLGKVLEGCDFTSKYANRLLASTIEYEKPFCLFKKLPYNVRYDAIIRTTPFHYWDKSMEELEQLTLVCDSLQWNTITGSRFSYKHKRFNIGEQSYCIFPSINSMPNLKKLTVVGRANSKTYRFSESGGLYLIKYIISKCSKELEEFDLVEQLSLNDPEIFDLSVIQCLIDNHISTLKVIRLKYAINGNNSEFLPSIIQLIEKYPSIKIEFYEINNDNSQKFDKYKQVKEFDFDIQSSNPSENTLNIMDPLLFFHYITQHDNLNEYVIDDSDGEYYEDLEDEDYFQDSYFDDFDDSDHSFGSDHMVGKATD